MKNYGTVAAMFGLACVLTACGGKETVKPTQEEAVQEELIGGDEEQKEVAGETEILNGVDMDTLTKDIPEIEVNVTGYYFASTDDKSDREISGFVENYKITNTSQEAVQIKGVVSNGGFQTEEPVEIVYYLKDNGNAPELSSTQVITDPGDIHIVMINPRPTAEELLDMGIKIKVYIEDDSPAGFHRDELELSRENVSEIHYDEEDITYGSEYQYNGDLFYTLNGKEHKGQVTLTYSVVEPGQKVMWKIKDEFIDELDLEELGE